MGEGNGSRFKIGVCSVSQTFWISYREGDLVAFRDVLRIAQIAKLLDSNITVNVYRSTGSEMAYPGSIAIWSEEGRHGDYYQDEPVWLFTAGYVVKTSPQTSKPIVLHILAEVMCVPTRGTRMYLTGNGVLTRISRKETTVNTVVLDNSSEQRQHVSCFEKYDTFEEMRDARLDELERSQASRNPRYKTTLSGTLPSADSAANWRNA